MGVSEFQFHYLHLPVNTIGKVRNPSVLPVAMSKISGQSEFCEGNSQYKPNRIILKGRIEAAEIPTEICMSE